MDKYPKKTAIISARGASKQLHQVRLRISWRNPIES